MLRFQASYHIPIPQPSILSRLRGLDSLLPGPQTGPQRGGRMVPSGLCPGMSKVLSTELRGKTVGVREWLDQLLLLESRVGSIPPLSSPPASASSRPHSEMGVVAWKG